METKDARAPETAENAVSIPADLFDKCRKFTRAREAQAAGLYPYFVAIGGSEGTEVQVDGHRKIMLGSNNYLGLTHDPRVIEAAEKVARQYGTGCTGSRFLNGTLDLHEKLETELAQYLGKEAALVFSTGFQTNLGIISSLVDRDDVVVIDKLDHACIVDGAILSQGEIYRYNHNDMAHLERMLQKARREHPRRGILIVVDGVFSMEGDLADLPHIVELARAHGARILVDEAHSIGVMGPTGAGVAEHFGLTDKVDLIMGTFSKSFASIGGVAAGDENVMHFVKHNARTMIFSASMPPYAVATVRECLRIMRAEPERRARLWHNTTRLKQGLESLGFDIGGTVTPIVPIIVGQTERTFVFWKMLFELGVFTNPVIAPAVPENTSRIRTSLMATHTDALIDEALEIFRQAGKKLRLISMPIPEIQVQPIRSNGERKEFVRFPWKVYRRDPNWVPPLISDVMKMLDPQHHPFHEHAEVQCFLARRGGGGPGAGEVVGRIAAIVNRAHNEFHGERTGFFGFFDVLPDPRIPPFLLRAAADWLKERGMERMRGPANFSSNEEWGLLVDGFDRPPMVMMTYNPPTYAGYLEDFGMVKAKDLVAYYMEGDAPPERLTRLAERIEKSANVRVRSLEKSRFREEVEKVREVYNSAWEKNWGFVPMTPAEIDHMAKELKPVFDPELILFAEVEGKPIGFAMALPDLNQALKKADGHLYPFGLVRMLLAARKIHALRVLTLGLVKEYRRKGIDTLMYLRLFQNGLKRGYRAGEFSWILEDNLPMRQALDNMGARVYKTYRLYDYPLDVSV